MADAHRPSLENWAFDLCYLVSRRSRDPSTKVGAVILRPDKTIASVGYNGFPRGCYDGDELYEDRDSKLARTVHAEVNAIVTAREPLHGYTLYVSPLMPCANCAGIIIQSGIKTVYSRQYGETPERWRENMAHTKQMFGEAGVHLTQRIVHGD